LLPKELFHVSAQTPLGFEDKDNSTSTVWLAVVIFGRDMSLGIAAIYYRYASLPAPKTFMRYWDFSIPSAEVHPTNVSKWNTFLQLGLIGATTTLPLLTESVLPGALASIDFEAAVKGMQFVVAGTTLWSGASYLWTKDAVRILGTNEELKRKQGFRGRMVLGVSFAAFLALAVELWRRESNDPNANAKNRPKA
jgi:cardiolipin synthase